MVYDYLIHNKITDVINPKKGLKFTNLSINELNSSFYYADIFYLIVLIKMIIFLSKEKT